jgi:hypothetical protein
MLRSVVRFSYEPICLVLKPGQFVHLGKGRLHGTCVLECVAIPKMYHFLTMFSITNTTAFRKLTRDPLPADDSHCLLRKAIVKSLENRPAPICASIAWDW